MAAPRAMRDLVGEVMKALAMRRRIRAITDTLKPRDQALTLAEIYARVRFTGKKPTRNVFSMLLATMAAQRQLERVDAPKGLSDKRTKYGYRSGPEPVTDGRIAAAARQKVKTGFAALARMENGTAAERAEWRRITNNGTEFARRRSL